MKCPNCNEELEKLSETEFFCKTDDMTVIIKDGKAKAQLSGGRLKSIEEALADLQRRVGDIDGESSLPFLPE